MVSGVEAPAASALRPSLVRRLRSRGQFQLLLGLRPVARTAHFALHRLGFAALPERADGAAPGVPGGTTYTFAAIADHPDTNPNTIQIAAFDFMLPPAFAVCYSTILDRKDSRDKRDNKECEAALAVLARTGGHVTL